MQSGFLLPSSLSLYCSIRSYVSNMPSATLSSDNMLSATLAGALLGEYAVRNSGKGNMPSATLAGESMLVRKSCRNFGRGSHNSCSRVMSELAMGTKRTMLG